MFGGQLLLDFIQVDRWLHFYKVANIILVLEGQGSSMTMPWLGIWICGLTMHPVEIDNVVDEAKRDIKYISNLPHCLPPVVELDDPLSQVRGICSNHGGMGEGMRPCSAAWCQHVQIPTQQIILIRNVPYHCHIRVAPQWPATKSSCSCKYASCCRCGTPSTPRDWRST